MSYTEFSVTYIHNKFWGLNSYVVPQQRVILDDRWHTTEDLFKTENQKYAFEIYWEEYMIGGEVVIPGEWNYACVKGKFFHLEKTRSAGFIDGQETFYYTMIYDDWTNEFQTNNVNICGTINLTGDRELVKEHIVQTRPLISNVNNFRYLNGKIHVDENIRVNLPEDDKKWIKPSQLSSFDYVKINKELEKLRLGEPNRDKLVIPFLYRTTPKYDWKWLIVRAIKRLESKSLGIYDVDPNNAQRRTLEVKFNTNELYTISTKENKVFNYAKSLVGNKYIEEIDLSGFTDLIQLSSTTLTPEYTATQSTPKFSLRGISEKLRSRFNWDRSLIPKMEEIITKVFAEGLGDVINRDVEVGTKTVFKNVTIAPIKRDVVWNDIDSGLSIRNPKWLSDLDSLIPNLKWYRNFILSNDVLKEKDAYMISGTNTIQRSQTTFSFNTDKVPNDLVIKWTAGNQSRDLVFPKPKWEEWLNDYLNRPREYDYLTEWTTGRVQWGRFEVMNQQNYYQLLLDQPFKKIKLCKTRGVQLVLPIHKYKLVEEGNEDSDDLDFTRHDWYNHHVLMLIPDYERKTHVLSIRCPVSEELDKDKFNLFFDEKDNQNPLKGKPIYPYITTELFEINESSVTDARWRKNLHNEWTKTVSNYWYLDPSTVAKHFLKGTYTVKYKTYYSRCIDKTTNEELKYCEYNQYQSSKSQPANGYRSGFVRFRLASPIPDVVTPDNYASEYQMHFTLPYSERLINILNAYGTLHDAIFIWKVLNSDIGKGKNHPNPLIWKNGDIRLMDKSDLGKLGSKDIIAVWINPFNDGWIYSRRLSTGLRQFVIPENEITEIKRGYGDIDGVFSDSRYRGWGVDVINNYDKWKLEKIKTTQPHILANTLVDWLTNNSYWPHPEVTPYYLIPLRVKKEKEVSSSRSDPTFTTGMVRPHDGFDYLCYYRFVGGVDKERFAFSDTSTPFKFDDDNYFVMTIPNTWSDSSYAVPTYSYRERIDNLSRESNIAFLINGAYSILGDSWEDEFFTGWRFSNNHGSQGWAKAEEIHNRMKTMVNKEDIFFEEFVKKEFKSNRTCNPTVLRNEYRYNLNGWQSFNITTIDDEIPPFMVKYLDPDNPLCQTLNSWKTSTSTTDEARLNELKAKLITTITNLKILLSTQNTWFALEGTDWYASVKLNIEDTPTWDFELFTTKPNLIKSRTTDTWKFENYKEDDVDVLINTSNEINIYGKRLMQKSRYTSDTNEIDLRLKITPLPDPKQTLTSSWYKVEMKTDDQDLIRDVIEVPKEQVKTGEFSVYERERLLREIDLRTTERSSEAQLFEVSKDRFKQKDNFEHWENNRRLLYRSANAALDTASSIYRLNPEGVARGAIELVDTMLESVGKEKDRRVRYELGVKEFVIKGDRMFKQHETNRLNAMDRLSQMSSRIQYPQMTNGLIYKEFNKSEGLNDVYLTQYYPSGKLLKYIKEYYKEYGYEILVRDFTCIGVASIKRHLRYVNIFKNEHPNERIRAMIQARALNGIFVSDSEIFW